MSYEMNMSEGYSGGNCARCGFEISKERQTQIPVICNHCGYTADHEMHRVLNDVKRRYKRIVVVLGVLFVTSYIHLVEWDHNFFTIIPLKTKQMLGMASSQDLRQVVDICTERKNHSCTIGALEQLSEKEPTNSDVMYDLGEMLRKTQQTDAAVAAYEGHFARGGNKAEAAFELARIMEARENYARAGELYAKAIDAKPETLQVTVIQAYVSMLMRTGKLAEAKAVIDNVRKNEGDTAKYFMAKEFDEIEKAISGKKI